MTISLAQSMIYALFRELPQEMDNQLKSDIADLARSACIMAIAEKSIVGKQADEEALKFRQKILSQYPYSDQEYLNCHLICSGNNSDKWFVDESHERRLLFIPRE